MPDANNPNPPKPAPAKPAKRSIQAPKGTRDLYPDDANLRRFITESWRNASIRHGFEEIDGPTFEDADLYKVKSGDGILAEMFGVFSGKDPTERENLAAGGEAPYALRPEFTPTLARMYAARAAQLGKPTKWFTAGPFFRAERPQRGRLREFLQWNVDFIGLPGASEASPNVDRLSEPDSLPPSTQPPAHDPLAESKARADAECISCCIELFLSLGLPVRSPHIHISDRRLILEGLAAIQSPADPLAVMRLLDKKEKVTSAEFESEAKAIQLDWDRFLGYQHDIQNSLLLRQQPPSNRRGPAVDGLLALLRNLDELGVGEWCLPDILGVVRGLAYYTGMVFEVIADGERAVAGGGRYDNLIELFGGPPTPAVGFGMGDVVLTNLLRDKGLLPEGKTLLDKLSQTPASLRPDAFVLTADETLDPLVRQLVADLRRGPDTNRPLHARHSYKSTRNVGKLLKEAAAQHARYAVIIENATTATLKPLDGGEQFQCALAEVPRRLAGLIAR